MGIYHFKTCLLYTSRCVEETGVDFLKACLEFLDANIVVKGEENLPKEGLYTFVSNHQMCIRDRSVCS